MKGIDIFCASQASTAICFSNNMEQNPSSTPSSSSSTFLLPGAAIDRHNPIIRDSRRIPKSLPPCSTNPHPPITPKSQKTHHKKKNNKRNTPLKENAKRSDGNNSSSFSKLDDDEKIRDSNGGNNGGIVRNRWKCTNPGDFISPPGSTRYLLRDKVVFDASSSDLGLAGKLSLEETPKSKDVKTEELFDAKPPSSSHSPDQVVVLRVSLHCRGCERKLRKHLSKMEGNIIGHQYLFPSIKSPFLFFFFFFFCLQRYPHTSNRAIPHTALRAYGASPIASNGTNPLQRWAYPKPTLHGSQGDLIPGPLTHISGCSPPGQPPGGVTSFNIEFAAKKVTVSGKVTPLDVLTNISKVKNAQLWSPTIASSIPPTLNLNNSEEYFKNGYKGAGA